MAATDHTRLRKAWPSADKISTDISRQPTPGMEIPPGADPARNREAIPSDASHGPSETQPAHGAAASTLTGAAGEPRSEIPLGRARIRRQVGTVCDYLELGVALASAASRAIAASPDSADQSLARTLDALAGRIEEEIWGLRHATLEPASLARTLDRTLSSAETVPQ